MIHERTPEEKLDILITKMANTEMRLDSLARSLAKQSQAINTIKARLRLAGEELTTWIGEDIDS